MYGPLFESSFKGSILVVSMIPGRPSHTPADCLNSRAACLLPLNAGFAPAPTPQFCAVESLSDTC
jgi:hypothetical protein